jgi:hypothetical protein
MPKFKISVVSLLLSFFIYLTACTSEAEQKELNTIQSYLGSVKIDADPLPDGLYVIDVTDSLTSIGTLAPAVGDTLIMSIKAYLAAKTSVIFVDKTTLAPDTLIYGSEPMIPALEEGLSYIRENQSLKIISPSALAYGEMRVGVIPPNSVLVFDVTCISHKPTGRNNAKKLND